MIDTKYFQFLELISQKVKNIRGNIITLKCGIYVYLSSEIKIAIFSIGHAMLVMKDIINKYMSGTLQFNNYSSFAVPTKICNCIHQVAAFANLARILLK